MLPPPFVLGIKKERGGGAVVESLAIRKLGAATGKKMEGKTDGRRNLTAASVTSMCFRFFFFYFLRLLGGNLAQTGVVWKRCEGGILLDAETCRVQPPGETVFQFQGEKKKREKKRHKEKLLICVEARKGRGRGAAGGGVEQLIFFVLVPSKYNTTQIKLRR